MIDNIRSIVRRVGLEGYVVGVYRHAKADQWMKHLLIVLNKIETNRWSAQSQRLLLAVCERRIEK